MIAIEGADTTGKTCLTTYIANKFKVPHAHLGLPPVGKRHFDIVREAILNNPRNTVYDRMIVGSYVFGKIKPDQYNQNPVTYEEMMRWLEVMHATDSVLIMCTASMTEMKRRFRVRGDAYINEAELAESAKFYKKAFNSIISECRASLLIYASDTCSYVDFVEKNAHVIQNALLDSDLLPQRLYRIVEERMG